MDDNFARSEPETPRESNFHIDTYAGSGDLAPGLADNKAFDKGLSRPSDNVHLVAMLAGAEAKLSIAPKQFDDLLGPEIGKALRDGGSKEVVITPGANGVHKIEVQVPKPVVVPQDNAKDGCYQLDIAKGFSAEMSRDANGKITIGNIKGITAVVDGVLGGKKTATILGIALSKGPNDDKGKPTTQVDSTGSRLGIEQTRTKYKDPKIYEGAKKMMDYIESSKAGKGAKKADLGALDIPSLTLV